MLKTAAIVGAAGIAALTLLPAFAVVAIAGQGQTAPSGTATTDIPVAYLGLYQDAALQRCPGLPWSVLAAIGKLESDHGRLGGATIHADGSVWPRIIGVALDGSPGIRRILDTDGGRYDGDTTYDRAVGPMQFLPSTWTRYGVDASGNGIADPQLTVLQLASEQHELQVVSLKSGHSHCIGGGDYPGCRVSHHWHGRAADIAAIDGRPVSSSNTVARDLALWANDLPSPSRPSEIGTPWPDLTPLPGFFSDAAHRSHLHLGWTP